MTFAVAGTLTREMEVGTISTQLPCFSLYAASEEEARSKVADILGIDPATNRGRFAPQLSYAVSVEEI